MQDVLGVLKNDVNLLGRPVKIVVADTGCKTALLPNKLQPQMDYIPWVNASAYRNEPILHSHGSYCKLLASEYFLCPQKKADVEIHGYQCLDRNGSGSNEAIAAALAYAFDQKADFVNMSLGIHAENERAMRAIIRSMGAVNRLGKACYEENGTLIFVAAGNEDERDDFIGDDVDAPAIFNWAIAVGALTDRGAKTDWSGDGAKLEFCFDGSDIYGIPQMSGTSFATPAVCGFAAYLKAYLFGNTYSARDIRVRLRHYAVHGGAYPHGPWCREHGWGSLGPYAKIVLGHVAELRKFAGMAETVGMFGADRSDEDGVPGALKKPPLGVLPNALWKELRVINLSGAIRRRISAKLTDGEHAHKLWEWLNELRDLVGDDRQLFGVMARELGPEGMKEDG